jgi:hypothetical protein
MAPIPSNVLPLFASLTLMDVCAAATVDNSETSNPKQNSAIGSCLGATTRGIGEAGLLLRHGIIVVSADAIIISAGTKTDRIAPRKRLDAVEKKSAAGFLVHRAASHSLIA